MTTVLNVFDDYDEYLKAWQSGVDNGTIWGNLRDTRDGGVEKFSNGKWQQVPYA